MNLFGWIGSWNFARSARVRQKSHNKAIEYSTCTVEHVHDVETGRSNEMKTIPACRALKTLAQTKQTCSCIFSYERTLRCNEPELLK